MHLTTHEQDALHQMTAGNATAAITALTHQHTLEDLAKLREIILSVQSLHGHELTLTHLDPEKVSAETLETVLAMGDATPEQWGARFVSVSDEQRAGVYYALGNFLAVMDAAALIIAQRE